MNTNPFSGVTPVVKDQKRMPSQGMRYTKIYVGPNNPEGFQKFLDAEVAKLGIEVVGVGSDVDKGTGKLRAVVTFMSRRGIIEHVDKSGVVLFEPKPSNGVVVFGGECETNFDWRM